VEQRALQRTEELRIARYLPISAYGVIGDCRSVALISLLGSIDWWCLPRFDGDPVLARLLDADVGGSCVITPSVSATVSRCYRPGTAILDTTFQTNDGRVVVSDFMPALTEAEKRQLPVPPRAIIRRVRCTQGRVPLQVSVRLRPNFGRSTPEVRQVIPTLATIGWADQLCIAYCSHPLRVRGGVLTGKVTLQEGEQLDLVLAYSMEAPAELPVPQLLDRFEHATEQFWCSWAKRCAYTGPYHEAVVRSAITLKLLTYAPSGAIVAAPTTSLPEWPGGVRNWDYRYCWLRDAAFTVRVLLELGYHREAEAFVDWLLYATHLTHPELQVVYTLYGEAHIPERELLDLEGYGGARPVRVGNAASDQLQLDVYGEVMLALWQYRRVSGRPFDRDAQRFIRGLVQTVLRRWAEPDDGIWKPRSGRAHHTHSKAMCYAALRCARELAAFDGFTLPLTAMEQAERAMLDWIEQHGFDPKRGAFVSTPGGGMDAALLWLALLDHFLPPTDPRIVGTVDAVIRELGQDELVYRYRRDDGLPGREGAFVICSFWLVEALARLGRCDQATTYFERLLKRANDLGLLAEELHPETGEQLGNFPQAFSHLGLISAALTLQERCC